ncbi:MAG: PEGA domain-containing protein, partial [Leptonema sp. (in: Bacteria)]|nr:PEGA domain-containing protein [Leptonema sp. (in: bacteria)]
NYKSENQTILVTATLLDFRSAELREKQKQIPAEFSVIPAKQKHLQQKSPADIAIEYNAEYYIAGTIEYEPVADPVYTDAKGNKIIITQEVRKQFEGKDLPANLQKLLAEKKPENLIVKIYLKSFNESGDLYNQEFKLLAANPYENTDFKTPANQIDETLRKKNPFNLRIDSQKKPGFVFLNGAFVGKTPLEIRAPSTLLRLRLEQEDCLIHNQNLQLKESTSMYIQCQTDNGKAQLNVISNPTGADVYLNHEKIGVTPLKADQMPSGVHRIRISKQGYIDSFHGVTLKDNQLTSINAKLTEGDTVEHYTDPGYAIQDWTYDDMTLGLFLQSLLFGGGWAYSNVRANSILDSIRSPWLPVFMPDPGYGLYQYQIMEDARLRALKWQRAGRVMTGLGVASLLGAGYYLYKSIDHNEKPFGEIEEGVSFSPIMIQPSFSMVGQQNLKTEPAYGFGLQLSF